LFRSHTQSTSSSLNPNAEPFPAPPSDDVKDILHDLSESRAVSMELKEDDRAMKRKRMRNLFPLSVTLVSIDSHNTIVFV